MEPVSKMFMWRIFHNSVKKKSHTSGHNQGRKDIAILHNYRVLKTEDVEIKVKLNFVHQIITQKF